MFFLNLSFGEFAALFTAVSAVVTALYLLDRAKRKKVVSTLRFWIPALTADEQQSRKRMREPWSLVLQIVGLLLLLLAIAQLQWGRRESRGRDHVLLLDTSAWSAERKGSATVLDREKELARQYLNALPARDRVLLARVDGLATPVTTFTGDRARLNTALAESMSQYSALNLQQALSFAQQAQTWSGGSPGEIVYVGTKRVSDADSAVPKISNLRVITADVDLENCGIRGVGVKRNEEDPNAWQVIVTVKNFGTDRRLIRLKTHYAGTVFARRALRLGPGEEVNANYGFITNTGGQLITEIEPGDAMPSDDRAAIRLPRSGALSIAIYTERPEILKPLFTANRRFAAQFFRTSEYNPKPKADLMVLDGVAPSAPPQIANFWIAPPREGSPLPVKSVVSDAVITHWNAETDLSAGLHVKEAHIPTAEVFETFEGDIPVASVAEGPIVVARKEGPNRARSAVMGFDPLSGPTRFEVMTPLLFANILRWLSPEAFQTLEVSAGRVGSTTVALDADEQVAKISLTDDRNFAVPFTVHDRSLQLFTSRPSLIRVLSSDRERFLSLTLPDVAEYEWKPPATARRGLPPRARFAASSVSLWQWLAVLGLCVLMTEWLLYGRRRVLRARKTLAGAQGRRAPERERELVSK